MATPRCARGWRGAPMAAGAARLGGVRVGRGRVSAAASLQLCLLSVAAPPGAAISSHDVTRIQRRTAAGCGRGWRERGGRGQGRGAARGGVAIAFRGRVGQGQGQGVARVPGGDVGLRLRAPVKAPGGCMRGASQS